LSWVVSTVRGATYLILVEVLKERKERRDGRREGKRRYSSDP
jgi:hypothetical protein